MKRSGVQARVCGVLTILSLVMTGCATSTSEGAASSVYVPNGNQSGATRPTDVQGAVPASSATLLPKRLGGGSLMTDPALVPYRGEVQHIFFHPLIAFPDRAFHNDPMATGFNDWFITVSEFDKILQALYHDGFILIDIQDIYQLQNIHGQTEITPRTLMLPPGKKPLILSVDDMNYYPYMIAHGTVSKLVLDAQGNVAALSREPDGHTAITYDNAIVPILDAFVAAHPDFSLNGAKGMINLTGYDGVLGYRTNDPSAPDYAQQRVDALAVIARLKATGWTFASHGWGHLDDKAISYSVFVADTNRWLREVEPLTGPTAVYVYPFGSRVPTGGAKFEYLLSKGFHVLCSVGPTTYVQWTPDALMMDRRHIDGIGMHNEPTDYLDLFDSRTILDPVRPSAY